MIQAMGDLFFFHDNIWSFVFGSWNSFRAIKAKTAFWYLFTTNFFQSQLLCVNEVAFGKPQTMGAGCQGNQPLIRGLELSAPPPWLLGRGEEIEFSQSCLHNIASLKPPKGQGSETFRVAAGRVARSEGAWKLHPPSHIPYPLHLSHLAVPELNIFL